MIYLPCQSRNLLFRQQHPKDRQVTPFTTPSELLIYVSAHDPREVSRSQAQFLFSIFIGKIVRSRERERDQGYGWRCEVARRRQDGTYLDGRTRPTTLISIERWLNIVISSLPWLLLPPLFPNFDRSHSLSLSFSLDRQTKR